MGELMRLLFFLSRSIGVSCKKSCKRILSLTLANNFSHLPAPPPPQETVLPRKLSSTSCTIQPVLVETHLLPPDLSLKKNLKVVDFFVQKAISRVRNIPNVFSGFWL